MQALVAYQQKNVVQQTLRGDMQVLDCKHMQKQMCRHWQLPAHTDKRICMQSFGGMQTDTEMGFAVSANTENGYASIGSVQTERNTQVVLRGKYAVSLEFKCSVTRRDVQALWCTNNRTM